MVRRLFPAPAILVALSILWPNANYLNSNKFEVQADVMLLHFLIVLGAALAIGALVVRLDRYIAQRYRQNYWVAVSVIAMFLFAWDALHPFHVLIQNMLLDYAIEKRYAVIASIFLMIVAIGVAWWLGGLKQALPVALLFYGTATAIPLASIVNYFITQKPEAILQGSASVNGDIPPLRHRANVYVFIVDQYARQDVLSRIFNFDNEPFLHNLEARGYKVQRNAMSNYSATLLSLASLLDMRYVATPEQNRHFEIRALLEIIAGNSEAVRRFRRHGYEFAMATFAGVHCIPTKVIQCLGHATSTAGLALQSIVRLTPFRRYLKYTDPIHLRDFHPALKTMSRDRSYFTFIHTAPPHQPYEYNEMCEYVSGPWRSVNDVTSPEARPRYVDMVKCVNKNINSTISLIDTIDKDAVVVFMSDHGSATIAKSNAWQDDQSRERFPTFLAIHFPSMCSRVPMPNMVVNVMEAVFSCLEDRRPAFLPERHFVRAGADFKSDPDGVSEVSMPDDIPTRGESKRDLN